MLFTRHSDTLLIGICPGSKPGIDAEQKHFSMTGKRVICRGGDSPKLAIGNRKFIQKSGIDCLTVATLFATMDCLIARDVGTTIM